MSNRTTKILLLSVVVLAAIMFVFTLLTKSPVEEKPTVTVPHGNTETTSSDYFAEPTSVAKPATSEVSGAAATNYQPVFPVSIGSEGIKAPVTVHYIVPEEFKLIYLQLLEGLNNYQSEIEFSAPIDKDAFSKALIYIRDLNPELFFIDWNSYNYKARNDGKVAAVEFNFFYDDIQSKAASLENEVNRIVKMANAYPNLFERELFVHDYLINNVTYLVDNAESGTAYGALINKKARCEGYARAFQLIMLRLGVPTFSVIGTADGERHMWNAVDLYGSFYFVDVTFDDNASETNLTSYSENEIGHSCFNIPEEILSKTHIISESGSTDRYGAYQNLFLPECNSYEFNYYRIRGLMVENFDQFKYILERYSSEKRACVFFKGEMPSSDSFQQAFKEFFDSLYTTGGYSIYYTPENSPVFMRNVYEISWTVE